MKFLGNGAARKEIVEHPKNTLAFWIMTWLVFLFPVYFLGKFSGQVWRRREKRRLEYSTIPSDGGKNCWHLVIHCRGIIARDDQSSFLMDSARCRALCRACSWRGSQWRGARRREGSPPSPPGSAPKIGDLGTRRILNYKTNIEKIWSIS